jgi:hypothetical protein
MDNAFEQLMDTLADFFDQSALTHRGCEVLGFADRFVRPQEAEIVDMKRGFEWPCGKGKEFDCPNWLEAELYD